MAPQLTTPQLTLDTPDRLMPDDETGQMLGVTVGTLATWRSTNRYDLPFVRVGRLIRYRLSDVRQWIDSRTEATTQAVPSRARKQH
jgi:predicted DNA-binding transcriptional regulator AlpA